jgi:hypothetical protein
MALVNSAWSEQMKRTATRMLRAEVQLVDLLHSFKRAYESVGAH